MKNPESSNRIDRAAWVVRIAVTLAFVALAGLSLQRHMRLESEEDLAMFDQMLWSVRQGDGLVTSISGNHYLQFPHHFFGEHVSPILYLFAWPAGLTSGPEALLIIQTLFVVMAAFPLRRLTERLTGSSRLGVAAALVWLLQPALWVATLYDFHMEAFEAFFLFQFVLTFLGGGWQAWIWGALYAACKEDAPIYLSALAFFLGWLHGRFRTGFAMATAAGLYSLAAVLWIGPAFSPTDAPLLQARLITPEVAGGIWPWIRQVFLNGPRWEHLMVHILPLGLFPLLGGVLLIPAAMAVGIMWLSSAPPQALLLLHYPLTVHPLLVIAAVAGLARATRLVSGMRRPVLQSILIVATAVWLALCLAFLWRSQVHTTRGFQLSRVSLFSDSYQEARQLLASIPSSEQVAALPNLIAHVARRHYLVLAFRGRNEPWLAMRFDNISYPLRAINYFSWLDRLLGPGTDYGVAGHDGRHVLLLHRGASMNLNAEALTIPRSMEVEDMEHDMGRFVIDPDALNGRAWRSSFTQAPGYMLHGPQLQLEAGTYRVGLRVRTDRFTVGHPIVFSVFGGTNKTTLASIELDHNTRGYEWLEMDVKTDIMSDVVFRCRKEHRGEVWLDAVRWQRIE